MKPRNTLILLAVAVGLLLFIRFYESKLPTTKEAAEREARVMKVDRDKVDGIVITNNEDKIELRKRDNEWFVEAPVKDRADSTVMTTLLTSLESLRKEAAIGEEKGRRPNLKDYGLAKANLGVKLMGPGAPPELLLGRDAAVEGKVYARLANSDSAFLISNELKSQLTKKPDDYRDRRLTNLTAAQIKKVTIKTASGEMELERANEHWRLNRPLAARADDAKVSDLVAQVLTTRIDSFVPESSASGLSDPRGVVTFFAEGTDKPSVLKVGQSSDKEKEKVYAKLSTRESAYLVPKKIEEFLNLKPADLRDKHLLRENFDMVDRINIESAGKPKVVLARKGESWTIHSSQDRPANTAEIKRFVNDLQNAQATAFVLDVGSDAAKHGLDQPSLKLSLGAYASENTAETKAGENPIVAILFGKSEGDNVYAKLDTEPFVVSVPRSFVERIFNDPVQWQDISIYKLKPDDVVSFEVTKGTQPAISLARSGKAWSTAKPDTKVNTTNVQSLLNTLCALRAARWAGAADQSGGEKLNLTISFLTSDKTPHKVTVSSPTPDGMWLATADGVDGMFVLPRPDVEALTLSLVESSKAETPPPGVVAP